MTPRILVYDHLDKPLFELDPNRVYSLKMVEKVNGEHSLSITTTHELEKGDRIFYHDGEKLREFVVLGDVASHSDGFTHEYYCVWSLQYDLSAAYIDDVRLGDVNHQKVIGDAMALVTSTSRWEVGSSDVETVSSGWFYYTSCWDALSRVVEQWVCEVDSTITLGNPVVRRLDCWQKVGDQTPKRRFDYGYDLTSIKRTVLDDLYVCRIVPRGKGEAITDGSEVTGYGRRVTIESVNPTGEEWIQDDAAAAIVRVPNGTGYDYPTQIVIYESEETPQGLYDRAMEDLETWTRPKVSYEASVLSLGGAGLDVQGVSLGDAVQVVDTTFGEDGLRLSARVLGIEHDLLDPSNDKLTIGNFQNLMSDTIRDLEKGLSAAQEQLIDTDGKADSALDDASEANRIAVEAQTVANAVNQHFWVDTDGAHVTEVTKDEWLDTTGTKYHTGSNSLWNSLGMLFRKGLTNLLAIVTSNTGGNVTGVSIYDGQGNGSNNIVASFTNNGATVGKTSQGHVVLDSDSMEVFTDASTSVADFGTYTRIGNAAEQNLYIGGGYVYFRDGSTDKGYIQMTTTGNGIVLAQGSTSVDLLDGNDGWITASLSAGDANTPDSDEGTTYSQLAAQTASKYMALRVYPSYVSIRKDGGSNSVNIEGDGSVTASGRVTANGVTSTGTHLYIQSTNFSDAVTPSASYNGNGILSLSAQNGAEIGYIRPESFKDGYQGIAIAAKRTDGGTVHETLLRLAVNSSGSTWVGFTGDGRDAWLSALGLTTVKTTTIASIIAVNSANATIVAAQRAVYGKLCTINIRWTNKAAISVPATGNISNVAIGTIPSGYRPATFYGAWSHGDNAGAAWYSISEVDGTVSLGAMEGTGAARTIAAGTEFRLLTTFIMA